jgi:hypothetical protein
VFAGVLEREPGSCDKAARVEVNQDKETKARDAEDIPEEVVKKIVKETEISSDPTNDPG